MKGMPRLIMKSKRPDWSIGSTNAPGHLLNVHEDVEVIYHFDAGNEWEDLRLELREIKELLGVSKKPVVRCEYCGTWAMNVDQSCIACSAPLDYSKSGTPKKKKHIEHMHNSTG